MKTSSSHLFKALYAAVAAILITASAQAQTLLQLDFTNSGGPVTTGYTGLSANFVANTPLVTSTVGAYTFSIDNVGSYNNGAGATEPLTAAGFYTFGNGDGGFDHSFSLSGLSAGDMVTLYAVSAWDGNPRGGYVTFGDSGPAGVQAQTLGDPGTTPTLANFTLIGTGTADGSGILSGTLNGAAGVYTTTDGTGTMFVDGQEGQVGAFVFSITSATESVPEPSTYALLGMGVLALVVLRRKKGLVS